MSTGTIPLDNVIFYTLRAGKTVEMTMTNASCVYFAMRRPNTIDASMVEYWNPAKWTFGENATSVLTFSKSESSYKFTLTNTGSSAIGIIFFGAYISQLPSD